LKSLSAVNWQSNVIIASLACILGLSIGAKKNIVADEIVQFDAFLRFALVDEYLHVACEGHANCRERIRRIFEHFTRRFLILR